MEAHNNLKIFANYVRWCSKNPGNSLKPKGKHQKQSLLFIKLNDLMHGKVKTEERECLYCQNKFSVTYRANNH